MFMLQSALFCLAFFGVFAAPGIDFTMRVGPASWIDALSDEEAREIHDACYPLDEFPCDCTSDAPYHYIDDRIMGGGLTARS